MDNNGSKPARNEELINTYQLLCSLISSQLPTTTYDYSDGSGERFNGYIDELITTTGDKRLQDFKLETDTDDVHTFVVRESYVRQLVGLVDYLHRTNAVIGYYCGRPPQLQSATTQGSSPTIHNQLNAEQQVSQNVQFHIEINQTIVALAERATQIEYEYPDKTSKENRFAKAIKKALPTVKGTLDVVALVLKIATEVGIDPHAALKLLSLS